MAASTLEKAMVFKTTNARNRGNKHLYGELRRSLSVFQHLTTSCCFRSERASKGRNHPNNNLKDKFLHFGQNYSISSHFTKILTLEK
mmetsp:Transcript_12261/g.25402  ORF Transcript_12261/g.25402 Transcript_12261/m.25402 type:complete len:87 (-) Transcript_12261:107-367(-)